MKLWEAALKVLPDGPLLEGNTHSWCPSQVCARDRTKFRAHTRSTRQNIFPAFGHCWLRGMKSKSEAILAHSKKHMVATSFFCTQLDQTTLDFDASTASVNPNQAPQPKQGPVCTLPPQDHARTWRPHGRGSAGSHPRPPSSCPQ